MRAVITTGREHSLAHELEAQELCRRYALPFAPRANRRVETLLAETGAELLGVFGPDGLVLVRDGVKLRFSAGMAELRIKRVLAGEHEPLTTLGEIGPKDLILDGTLGLARDALVFAATGAHVLGLEGQPLLAAFAEAGLRVIGGAAGQAAARVKVAVGSYPDVLAKLPNRAYDVVYLDPMFTDEVQMPPEYELFRSLADHSPLFRSSVEHARRVARRCVLIKDGPRGNVVKSLGFPLRELTFGTRVRYARIDAA